MILPIFSIRKNEKFSFFVWKKIECFFFLQFNRTENGIYLFILDVVSSIGLIYLLRESRRNSIIPILALIYRWNLFGSFSWLTPIFSYVLLIVFLLFNRMSIDKVIFSLLFVICRPQNCFLIFVHLIFYQYVEVKDARLAFLLSQSAFFHLVCISNFNWF